MHPSRRDGASAAWELVGAMTGAGLASGREVAAFFAQYGPWSRCGVLLAVLTMVYLAGAKLPRAWQGQLPARLWRSMQGCLLIATGGVMLAGAGEVALLALPLCGARLIGMAGTLGAALLLARRTETGLAFVSRILLAVLGAMVLLGLTHPPMRAAQLTEVSIPAALLRGMAYGGFNAALLVPVLAQHKLTPKGKRRSLLVLGLLAGAMLLLCNEVLLRHPALLHEPMPFIRLAGLYGRWGYGLGVTVMWLAILSTLTAAVRGLGGGVWPILGVALTAMLGFSGAVEFLYPLLGAGCMVMLLAMRAAEK